MEIYNRIMTYVWLLAGIGIFCVTTYMSVTDGIRKWSFYYIFSLVAFLMYFLKRWMVKRMNSHMKFMQDQQSEK